LSTSFSFRFDRSQFENPKIMEKKLQRAIFGVAKYWDGRIESHMKQKAPWHDRTTNARNGLRAFAAKTGAAGSFVIVLVHTVTYGIYLELGTRFMKARPIIIPTLGTYGPKVIKTLTKILDRLGGGAAGA
jgi:HK97 gp10 family phage protein